MIWLNMLIRAGEEYRPSYQYTGRYENCGVSVPVSHLWWEGPDDLHIHFVGGGAGFTPAALEGGDYIIPNPYSCGDELVLCYSMSVSARDKRLIKADDKYLRMLQCIWYSPNLPEWAGEDEVKAYLRRYKAWVKRQTKKGNNP
jgi:hypothetical protein